MAQLIALGTGRELRFEQLFDGTATEKFDARESFFLCSLGLIIRILRGAEEFGPRGSRPAIVQIIGFDGVMVDELHKSHETASAFSLTVGEPLRMAEYYELSGRPTFVPPSNIKNYYDVHANSYSMLQIG